jgi:hypothetical protein
MIDSITLHSRLCSVLGLLESASEADILDRAKQLMKEAEKVSAESEHDRIAREKMEAMNSDRAMAEFVIAEQQRYDRNPPPRL